MLDGFDDCRCFLRFRYWRPFNLDILSCGVLAKEKFCDIEPAAFRLAVVRHSEAAHMLMLRRFWSEHKHRTGKHRKAVRFDSRPNGPNAFRWEDRLLVVLLTGLILGWLVFISYIFVF